MGYLNGWLTSHDPCLPRTGTEPKLKYYLEVAGDDPAAAAALAERLAAALPDLIGVQRHQLLVPPTH